MTSREEENPGRSNNLSSSEHSNDAHQQEGFERQNAPWPLLGIEKPHPNDVLYGRGGGSNHHPGNKRYRKLAKEKRHGYLEAVRDKKGVIAIELVRSWRTDQNPPGRFLKRNTTSGLWDDMGDKMAQEKTAQLFREHRANARRKSLATELTDKCAKNAPKTESCAFADDVESSCVNSMASDRAKVPLTREHSLGTEHISEGECLSLDGFEWNRCFNGVKSSSESTRVQQTKRDRHSIIHQSSDFDNVQFCVDGMADAGITDSYKIQKSEVGDGKDSCNSSLSGSTSEKTWDSMVVLMSTKPSRTMPSTSKVQYQSERSLFPTLPQAYSPTPCFYCNAYAPLMPDSAHQLLEAIDVPISIDCNEEQQCTFAPTSVPKSISSFTTLQSTDKNTKMEHAWSSEMLEPEAVHFTCNISTPGNDSNVPNRPETIKRYMSTSDDTSDGSLLKRFALHHDLDGRANALKCEISVQEITVLNETMQSSKMTLMGPQDINGHMETHQDQAHRPSALRPYDRMSTEEYYLLD